MPADDTLDNSACLFKYRLLVLTVWTLYFEKFTSVFPNLAYHYALTPSAQTLRPGNLYAGVLYRM